MVSIFGAPSFSYFLSPALNTGSSTLGEFPETSPDAISEAEEVVDRYVECGKDRELKTLLARYEIPFEPEVVRQITAARLMKQEMADARWHAVTKSVAHFSKAVELLDEALAVIRKIRDPEGRNDYLNRRALILCRMHLGTEAPVVKPLKDDASVALAAIQSSPQEITREQRRLVLNEAIPHFVKLGQEEEARRILKFLSEEVPSPIAIFGRHGLLSLAELMVSVGMRGEAAENVRLIISDRQEFNEDADVDQRFIMRRMLSTASLLGDRDLLAELPEVIDVSIYTDPICRSYELTLSVALFKAGRIAEASALAKKNLAYVKKYLKTHQDLETIDSFDEESADEVMSDLIWALAEQKMIPELRTAAALYQERVRAFRNRGIYDENASMVTLARRLAGAGLYDEARNALEEYFAQREIHNHGFLWVPARHLRMENTMSTIDYLLQAAEDCYQKAQEEAALLGGLGSAPFRQELRRHIVVASSAYLRMIGRLPEARGLFAKSPRFVRALAGVISKNDKKPHSPR